MKAASPSQNMEAMVWSLLGANHAYFERIRRGGYSNAESLDDDDAASARNSSE